MKGNLYLLIIFLLIYKTSLTFLDNIIDHLTFHSYNNTLDNDDSFDKINLNLIDKNNIIIRNKCLLSNRSVLNKRLNTFYSNSTLLSIEIINQTLQNNTFFNVVKVNLHNKNMTFTINKIYNLELLKTLFNSNFTSFNSYITKSYDLFDVAYKSIRFDLVKDVILYISPFERNYLICPFLTNETKNIENLNLNLNSQFLNVKKLISKSIVKQDYIEKVSYYIDKLNEVKYNMLQLSGRISLYQISSCSVGLLLNSIDKLNKRIT